MGEHGQHTREGPQLVAVSFWWAESDCLIAERGPVIDGASRWAEDVGRASFGLSCFPRLRGVEEEHYELGRIA